MRYAIISDIHANETALRAVLADAADARAERIICLGDVLGYGPDPVSTLELVHKRAHVCLAGNHDDAVSGRFPVEDFTSFAAAAVERHRAALAQPALDWLRTLPYTCVYQIAEDCEDGAFACAHGTFASPERFDYVLEPQDALASWQASPEQLLFIGHSHKPGIFVLGPSGVPHGLEPDDFVLEPGKRYLVNVGSVGYPRSGVCRSSYCVYDTQTRTVYFRTVPFDVDGYRAKMNGQGLDEAPWVRARVEERERDCPVARADARFGKLEKNAAKPGRAGTPLPAAAGSGAPSAKSGRAGTPLPVARGSAGHSVAWVMGALVVAGAGVWCTRELVKSVPARADVSNVAIATALEEEESAVSDAAPMEVGEVVDRRRCTVPSGGRRLRYQVKLKRGTTPAWVHLRFENGNGEPAGDGLWYQNVKASKRSPKAGLVAPEGATAAFLEVVKAHATDVCEVDTMILEPLKENAK